jgi:hypothetical protein
MDRAEWVEEEWTEVLVGGQKEEDEDVLGGNC